MLKVVVVLVDIDSLQLNYFINEYPVPYELKKGAEIFIYPIKVKDFPIYANCKELLEIDKNTINDIDVIQMNYLEFLINRVLVDINAQSLFAMLFQLCIHKNIALSKDNGKDCIVVLGENDIIESIISAKEFDDIKKIILFQNDKDYDDRYINPEVKAEYEKYCKMVNKGVHNPTLEEQKTYVMSKNGYTMEQINNMVYRTFEQIFNHCINSEIYLAQKIIQASFKYEVKDDVKHPIFKKRVDKYKEMFTDAKSFEQKIQQING